MKRLFRDSAGEQALLDALGRVVERLDHLVALVEQLTAAGSGHVRPVAGELPTQERAEFESAARHRRGARGRRRLALHGAIETVLLEATEPLTASDIAERIAERRLFTPPRSGKPLTANDVNSRVSNPRYRARFSRSNGRIRLAGG